MHAARQQMWDVFGTRGISNAGQQSSGGSPCRLDGCTTSSPRFLLLTPLTHTVTQPTHPPAHLVVSRHSLRLSLDSSKGLMCHVINALQPRTPATPDEAAPVLDAAGDGVWQLVQVPPVMQGCHDSIHLVC